MEPQIIILELKIERPEGVSIARIKDWLRQEAFAMTGGLDPEDPLFGANDIIKSITKKD